MLHPGREANVLQALQDYVQLDLNIPLRHII